MLRAQKAVVSESRRDSFPLFRIRQAKTAKKGKAEEYRKMFVIILLSFRHSLGIVSP